MDNDSRSGGEDSVKKKFAYKEFPKQIEFAEAVHDPSYQIVGYGGSIRGGKTIAGLGTLMGLCVAFPGSRWAVIRENLTQIKKNIFTKLDEVFPEVLIKTKPTAYNAHTLVFTNGSQIVFHAENFDSQFKYLEDFKGLEVDGFLFDEVSGISEKTFNKALERVGTWRMDERQQQKAEGNPVPPNVVMFTCNPTWNWVKSRFYDKYKDGTLPDYVKYIPSTVYDNPYVSEDWIEMQRATMEPLDFKMMIDGDWQINLNEKPFFYTYKQEKHVSKKRLKWDKHESLWLAWDFNWSPGTCIVFQEVERWGFYCLKVHQVDGGTRAVLDEIAPLYEDWEGGINICGDFSGNQNRSSSVSTDFDIIEEIMLLDKTHFIHTKKANERHKYSRTICNEFLFRLNFLIDEEGCPELISDMQIAKPTKDGKLFKDRDKGYAMDACDAFRYFVSARFPKGVKDIRELAELNE